MPQIRILPDNLINKIAAGEVIERPASVVKELVENALDAAARRIIIEVEAGGKRLVRVTDDGSGMTHEDVLLAFERHATSKLRTPDDLLAIATLGFRGEALPAIAAVSRVLLETRPQPPAAPAGTRIEIHAGKLLSVKEVGCAPGTRVEVRDLFYNIPARRKFLRSDSTELAHIASLASHYALAHPERAFALKSATRALLDVAPADRLHTRAYQVLGRQILDELIDIGRITVEIPPMPFLSAFGGQQHAPRSPGTITVQGFVSRPGVEKASSNIYTFVNRRPVRERVLQSAIREAYRNVLPARAYPTVLLFLELPATEVDVNVHPQKIEVRFRQQGFVHDFVQQAIRQALTAARPAARFPAKVAAVPQVPVAEAARQPSPFAPAPAPPVAEPFALRPPKLAPREQPLPFTRAAESTHAAAAVPESTPPGIGESELATLKPLGQISNSFIVAVSPSGLWLVDQHVAHERILFENHLRARNQGAVAGQRLLTPALVELTPRQQALWQEIARELEANGFESEAFGRRTIAVKAAPASVATSSVERLLREILESVERETQPMTLQALQRQIAASVACHAAIKVNMPLEQTKMEWLLRELARTEAPMICPHGRPIVLHYSLREIQQAFKRT